MSLSKKTAAIAALITGLAWCIAAPASAAGPMKNMQDQASAESHSMAMAPAPTQLASRPSTAAFAPTMSNAPTMQKAAHARD
jgi:hypothetical protein